MSTRVQKGGAVFKPVAKPRARPSHAISRQNSTSPNEAPIFVSAGSMPPPLVIPTRIPSIIDENSGNLSSISTQYTFSMNTTTSTVITSPPPIALSDRPPELSISQRTAMDYPRADAFFSDCIGKENIPGSEGSHAIESCSGIVTSDPSLSSPASPVVLDLSNRKRNSNLGESGDDRESRSQNRSRSTPGESRKPRKPRAPSLRPLDADANPGEDIDPTVITMAALCSDTGQGRVSSKAAEIQSNHVAWRAASRDKSARMKSLVEARKFRGRDDDKDDPRSSGTQSNKSPIVGPSLAGGSPAGVSQQEGPAAEDGSGQGFDYSQGLATSRFNVQVRIGLNGETFIDEESLFVDRSHEDNTEQYTHVEESEHTKFVNSGTYGKKVRGSRWGAEETELFYHALSQFGENYELISYVLPGRDRKSCKNKFKSEDRKNPSRITYCLNNRIPYDMQTLARMTGKDFSGPTPEIRAPTPLSLAEPEPSSNVEG